MRSRPTFVLALLTLAPLGAAFVGAAPATAGPTDPTVVRLLGGGVMQVASPDDTSLVLVSDAVTSTSITAMDQLHPMEAVAPCTVTPDGEQARCPTSQVTSVSVLMGPSDDQLITRVPVPVVAITGGGNDITVDWYAPQATYLTGAGDDEVRPGSGADTFFGGTGTDYVWYRDETSPVSVSLDDVANDGADARDDNIHSDVENILGGLGDDTLVGSGGDNVIDGRQGNDTIFGLGGNDTFVGLGNGAGFPNGADNMFGGDGFDTVSYADRPSGVVVRLDDVAFDGQPTENDNVHSDIEKVIGSPTPDVLTGDSAANVIDGLGGNDLIDGGLGADVLDGGAGTDSATYADRATGVRVSLNGAADDGAPGEGDDVLDIENVSGGSGNDILVGNGEANLLSGNLGNDTVVGRGGQDLLAGGLGTDRIDGGSGLDTVTYVDHVSPVTVSLDGIVNDGQAGENDHLSGLESIIGGGGNDNLIGSAGPNVLQGLLGNDRLRGLAGNDTLVGGDGTDFADGGTGVDVCQAETDVRCP
jgi:Ca2+-binding RTX toxin-like protein